MNLAAAATTLSEVCEITISPKGSSMLPLIRSGDEVVVTWCEPSLLETGDIVLCKVNGSYYLHLVKAVDAGRGRVLIGNNRGRTNGWCGLAKVYGIVTKIAGKEQSRARTKIRAG
jgi:hypothetical protein